MPARRGGIKAISAYRDAAPPVDRDELVATRERLRSRGPDAGDAWVDAGGRVGLGHRRLAIIDLSPAGAQPMHFGALTIVFNGEIYNYRQLREQLEARGHTFVSHSDTEVMLHLFHEKQERMLDELRGMFALIIWDAARRRMFLARDPYGIKPLYYADDGGTLRAASQVRALAESRRVDRKFDPAGAAGFFLRGTVPEPYTMYRSIHALPAGSSFRIDGRGGG